MNASAPWVIPYVDFYTGATRILTIELRQPTLSGGYKPVVSIDGRQYIVVWGAVHFEIPVERNVHISAHLQGETIAYTASALLPPGEEPLGFLYDKTLVPMPPPRTEAPR